MSILIKGMEMPRRCEKCDLAYDDYGYFVCPFTKASYKSKQRPSWCPLIELPPHGRLIDADAAALKIWWDLRLPSNLANAQFFVNELREMPTVIESEGEE